MVPHARERLRDRVVGRAKRIQPRAQDPDNVEFFSRFRPATLLDRIELPLVIGTLIGFGLVAEFIDDPPELVLAGLTFACVVLIYRMEVARRFWDRSMSIEPLVDDERTSG